MSLTTLNPMNRKKAKVLLIKKERRKKKTAFPTEKTLKKVLVLSQGSRGQ